MELKRWPSVTMNENKNKNPKRGTHAQEIIVTQTELTT